MNQANNFMNRFSHVRDERGRRFVMVPDFTQSDENRNIDFSGTIDPELYFDGEWIRVARQKNRNRIPVTPAPTMFRYGTGLIPYETKNDFSDDRNRPRSFNNKRNRYSVIVRDEKNPMILRAFEDVPPMMNNNRYSQLIDYRRADFPKYPQSRQQAQYKKLRFNPRRRNPQSMESNDVFKNRTGFAVSGERYSASHRNQETQHEQNRYYENRRDSRVLNRYSTPQSNILGRNSRDTCASGDNFHQVPSQFHFVEEDFPELYENYPAAFNLPSKIRKPEFGGRQNVQYSYRDRLLSPTSSMPQSRRPYKNYNRDEQRYFLNRYRKNLQLSSRYPRKRVSFDPNIRISTYETDCDIDDVSSRDQVHERNKPVVVEQHWMDDSSLFQMEDEEVIFFLVNKIGNSLSSLLHNYLLNHGFNFNYLSKIGSRLILSLADQMKSIALRLFRSSYSPHLICFQLFHIFRRQINAAIILLDLASRNIPNVPKFLNESIAFSRKLLHLLCNEPLNRSLLFQCFHKFQSMISAVAAQKLFATETQLNKPSYVPSIVKENCGKTVDQNSVVSPTISPNSSRRTPVSPSNIIIYPEFLEQTSSLVNLSTLPSLAEHVQKCVDHLLAPTSALPPDNINKTQIIHTAHSSSDLFPTVPSSSSSSSSSSTNSPQKNHFQQDANLHCKQPFSCSIINNDSVDKDPLVNNVDLDKDNTSSTNSLILRTISDKVMPLTDRNIENNDNQNLSNKIHLINNNSDSNLFSKEIELERNIASLLNNKDFIQRVADLALSGCTKLAVNYENDLRGFITYSIATELHTSRDIISENPKFLPLLNTILKTALSTPSASITLAPIPEVPGSPSSRIPILQTDDNSHSPQQRVNTRRGRQLKHPRSAKRAD